MYRESSPRYSYQTEDFEGLWFRLQWELSRRPVWNQGEVIELMEWLEDEAQPNDNDALTSPVDAENDS